MASRNHQFDECKGPWRHAWFDHDGSGFSRPEFGVALHVQCFRCGTVRRDVVSRIDGQLLSRRYYYPEGYRDAKADKPSTEQLRLYAIKKQRQNLRIVKGMPRL